MRTLCFVAWMIAAALPGLGQNAAGDAPGLPKDPLEVFAMAAPYYDFADPALKPFHLKAAYQLYDEKGRPGEQGIYEYWWASPKVRRSTWTRPGATRTDWYTTDGKHAYLATGGRLKHFERGLQSALFSPSPITAALDPDKERLDLKEKGSNGTKFLCISLVPIKQSRSLNLPPDFYPTYCFDSKMPVLRASYSLNSLSTEFSSVAKVQGKFLSREILIFGGGRKLFSAKVDSVTGLDPSDPALTPGPEAAQAEAERTQLGEGVTVGLLIKKQTPDYPPIAKMTHEQGTVVLGAIIGTDGKIHDLEVLCSPSESLAAAASEAVSHWEYKPYLLGGQPVEVDTTINVIFTLGG